MLLNELNQTISDVHGLPVDPALLPLRSDRTIVYREGCSIPYEFKRSEDLLDYVVDMMKWLEAGEDIVSVLGWTDSDSLRITSIQFSATAVLAYVIGGEDDARQTVSLSIATSLGKVKLVQFAVHTKGVAVAYPIVTALGDDVTVSTTIVPLPEPEPAPKLKFTPSSIGFPETEIGSSSSKTVAIKNVGTAAAYIRAITINAPFSQRNNGEINLEPGETLNMTLTFTPQVVGIQSGTLSIGIGDYSESVLQLAGNAVLSSP